MKRRRDALEDVRGDTEIGFGLHFGGVALHSLELGLERFDAKQSLAYCAVCCISRAGCSVRLLVFVDLVEVFHRGGRLQLRRWFWLLFVFGERRSHVEHYLLDNGFVLHASSRQCEFLLCLSLLYLGMQPLSTRMQRKNVLGVLLVKQFDRVAYRSI